MKKAHRPTKENISSVVSLKAEARNELLFRSSEFPPSREAEIRSTVLPAKGYYGVNDPWQGVARATGATHSTCTYRHVTML